MRPSRRFLWLLLLALVATLVAVLPGVSPVIGPVQLALVPAGLMVAVFLFDWIISARPGRAGIRIEGPREVFSGEKADFVFLIDGKAPPGNFSAVISPSEGLRLMRGDEPATELSFSDRRAEAVFLGRRRGDWALERIWLFWRSRFGLIDFAPSYPLNLTVRVVPNIRRVSTGEIDLQLRSRLFGGKKTHWRGEGSEFHQMNEYVQGMDPRSIDWKRSARAGTLLAKEMQAEQNHHIIVALDNGHLMREEIDGLPKVDHNINTALALAWAGLQGGDMVGLYAFDARPRLFSPPRTGRMAFSHLRSQMAQLEYRSVETNHTLALSHLQGRLGKRSLVVVLSDFADPLTAQLMVDHLTVLNRHHVVIFLCLKDPLLERLVRAKTSSMADIARSVSAARMLEERRSVLAALARIGVHVIETNPGDMPVRLVNTYLALKAREAL